MKKAQYQIRVDGQLVEIEAAEFAVFGYDIFIVHRDHIYPSLWTVSEPRTGLSVKSRQPTRKAAIEQATLELLKHTPETIQELIQGGLCVPPHTRYQQENYEQTKEANCGICSKHN